MEFKPRWLWVYEGGFWGGYIGIMEKKMETTIVELGIYRGLPILREPGGRYVSRYFSI